MGLYLVCLCFFVLFLLLVWLFCVVCVALHGDSSMDYVSILVQFCFWCTLSYENVSGLINDLARASHMALDGKKGLKGASRGLVALWSHGTQIQN